MKVQKALLLQLLSPEATLVSSSSQKGSGPDPTSLDSRPEKSNSEKEENPCLTLHCLSAVKEDKVQIEKKIGDRDSSSTLPSCSEN